MADDLINALQTQNRSSSVLGGIANPAVVNPLAGYGSAISAVQGIQELQEKAAQQAWGQALQQATDPSTGVVDFNKAQSLAAQNPTAAMGMATNLQNTSGLRGQQIAQAAGLHGLVGNMAASLMNDPSDDNLAKIRGAAVASNLPPSALTEIDRIQALPPEQRGAEAYKHVVGNLDALGQLARGGYGAPAMTQFGGTQAPVVSQPGSPYGPPRVSIGGAVPNTPNPEWLGESVPITDNNKMLPDGTPNPNFGRTSNVVRGDLLRAAGVDPSTLAQPGGSQPGPLGTGRLPPALQNPNKPAPTQPAAAPAPTATTTPAPRVLSTTPSPADLDTQKQAAPRFQAEIDAGTGAQAQQATLGNMLADTAQFTTGPLAGIVGKVRNLAGNFGLNINTDAQSAKESFNKLAAGLANAQGAGSDQRMAVNINANPHEELSPAGVDLVTRQLQGNADYLQARAKLAQQYPNRGDYGGFQQKAAPLDPRVFQLTRMTGPQRTTYWNALSDTAQTELGAAIRNAKGMGVLGN